MLGCGPGELGNVGRGERRERSHRDF